MEYLDGYLDYPQNCTEGAEDGGGILTEIGSRMSEIRAFRNEEYKE